MSCSELVLLVTEYLEGALPPPERLRFDAHLAACDGCSAHLDQIRKTISAVGRLRERPENSLPRLLIKQTLATHRISWLAYTVLAANLKNR